MGMRLGWRLVVVLLAATEWAHGADAANPFSEADLAFFEKRVRPILVERCQECHSARHDKVHGGLVLDRRERILQGGDSGPAVRPGQPDESLLLEAVRYERSDLQMPPDGKLPEAEIAILATWIERGLAFPSDPTAPRPEPAASAGTAAEHWSFQPFRSVDLPSLPAADLAWPRTRIDWFVRAGQRQQEFFPAPAADRRTLLRRLKWDLLGLPPTIDEVEAFERDPAPDAYERLVDQFLAAPQFGERWGRHWLDLTRYCDIPESWREGEAEAWLYRDWIVGAMNRDLPYDQFVRDQLAADLLDSPDPRDVAALGFLGLSPTYWKELKLDHLMIKQVVAEEWEERVEAISSTFLGLTLACARCHDHKFDPLTTRDYYAMAGVLASIQLDDRPLLPPAEAAAVRPVRDQIRQWEKEREALLKPPATPEKQQQAGELLRKIDDLKQAHPAVSAPRAFGVVEASLHVLPDGEARTKLVYQPNQPQDVALQIRGNAARPGEVVPRGFPAILAAAGTNPFRAGSGRRELANAIVTDAAPLTARVLVNRVWKHHFGRGLVTTPSNFGVQGDRPSHPELLDDLAARFVAEGWSLKWLHRELVLSATYRQSSQSDASRERDPDNVWLARMPVRRLEVEAWRDGILFATGELDQRVGGPPRGLDEIHNRRRTLYGTVKRRELADLLRLYDFPDPIAHVGSREPTTTPLQQLFVLNSPFMRERSVQLVRRWPIPAGSVPEERLHQWWRAVLARSATSDELDALRAFLAAARERGSAEEEAWTQLAQVLLGSNELLFVE